MTRVFALTRAQWQTMRSYRIQLLMSIAGILAGVVPLFFVARALQPVMAGAIRAEGGSAFGFLAVGLASLMFVTSAVNSLPAVVSDQIRSGMFEAVLATPTSLLELLLGFNAFDLVLATVRATVLLGAAAALGATILPGRILPALLIVLLIVLAHLPIGVLGAAMILAFRTAGPLPRAVALMSGLLGGVYYPTSVIPSWLQAVSSVLPLSHGLRALRKVLLQGASLSAIAPDLLALVGTAAVLAVVGATAASFALRHARAQGTLTQY